jgi:hypothetical protein
VRADCVAREAEAEPIKVPAIDEGFYGQTANSEIS